MIHTYRYIDIDIHIYKLHMLLSSYITLHHQPKKMTSHTSAPQKAEESMVLPSALGHLGTGLGGAARGPGGPTGPAPWCCVLRLQGGQLTAQGHQAVNPEEGNEAIRTAVVVRKRRPRSAATEGLIHMVLRVKYTKPTSMVGDPISKSLVGR